MVFVRPLILLDKTQGRQFVLFSFEEYFVLGVLWLWLQRNDCPSKAVFCEVLTSSLTFWSNQKWSLEVYIVWHSDVSTWNLLLYLISHDPFCLLAFCSRIRNLLEVRFTLASQAGKTRCTLWIRSSENSKPMFEYERPFKGVICLLIACSFFVWCVWLAIRSLTRS